jgi:hypothetical protein
MAACVKLAFDRGEYELEVEWNAEGEIKTVPTVTPSAAITEGKDAPFFAHIYARTVQPAINSVLGAMRHRAMPRHSQSNSSRRISKSLHRSMAHTVTPTRSTVLLHPHTTQHGLNQHQFMNIVDQPARERSSRDRRARGRIVEDAESESHRSLTSSNHSHSR